jgi:hypothetical protein
MLENSLLVGHVRHRVLIEPPVLAVLTYFVHFIVPAVLVIIVIRPCCLFWVPESVQW